MRLILVTNNYPFEADGGEIMFLDAEIKHLVEGFEEVVVAPLKPFGRCSAQPVPFSVDLSLSATLNKSKLALVISFLSSFLVSKDRKVWLKEAGQSLRWGFKGFLKFFWWSYQAFQAKRWALHKSDSEKVIIYSYWNTALTVGFSLASEFNSNIAVVSRVHGYDLYRERGNPPYIPYRSMVVGSLRKIFPISKAGRDYLIREYGACAEKLTVSYLGTKDPGFKCQPSADGLFHIISCSFLVPVKRVDLIAKVVCEVARRNKGVKFRWTHIGGGDRRHVECALKAPPKNLVVNFAGHLNNSSVYDFYESNKGDLFLNLSESEGIPVSMMEACSVGLPIVATDVGGVSEIVTPDNGILVDANPAESDVVTAIQFFIDANADLRQVFRASAYDVWHTFFSSEVNYNRFLTELKKISLEMLEGAV